MQFKDCRTIQGAHSLDLPSLGYVMGAFSTAPHRLPSHLLRCFTEIQDAVRFLTRMPLPRRDPTQPWDLGRSLRWAPVAGLVVAAGETIVLLASLQLRVPSVVTAVLVIAAGIGMTGALHQDGLADVADGFGGGQSLERKLAIMRDSRIGSFGTLALGCALLGRFSCLQTLIERGGNAAAVALVVAAVLSRVAMLVPLALLPHARSDGLAHAAGVLTPRSLVIPLALALFLAGFALAFAQQALPHWVVTTAAAGIVAVLMTGLSHRQIGGVTGDVAGATQQVGDLAVLIVLSAATNRL